MQGVGKERMVGLADVAIGLRRGRNTRMVGGKGRKGHDGCSRYDGAYERQRPRAVHDRHDEVENHGVGLQSSCQDRPLRPVARLAHDREPAVEFDPHAYERPDVIVVLDQQDVQLRAVF
jgi:hypothetical protein